MISFTKAINGGRPFEVRWATRQAIEDSTETLRRLESLLDSPITGRQSFSEEVATAWAAVLSTRTNLARSLGGLRWEAPEDDEHPNFMDHDGKLCSQDEAIDTFLQALPPALVPSEAAPASFDLMGSCNEAWTDLLERCQPVFEQCGIELPANPAAA